jgi:hypothetical protein
MKAIVFFILFILVPIEESSAKLSCINSSLDSYIGVESKSNNTVRNSIKGHELVFSKDSCGIKGCEYFIFSEAIPGCKVLSLNEVGFMIPKSFKGTKVKIRQNKIIKKFWYSHTKSKFLDSP